MTPRTLTLTGAALICGIIAGCSDDVALPGADAGAQPPDQSVTEDGPVPDAPAPDTQAPDSALPDMPTPDASQPDAMQPDMLQPDMLQPDMMQPDMLQPDMLQPDMLQPDMPLPTCTDKSQNGAETDVDCGGPTCPKCASGRWCKAAADCWSGVCNAGVCAFPACNDAVKNGSETDVDCGGPACAACPDKKGCLGAKDCQSGVCQAGQCVAPTCADKVKNGAETDVDCGGGSCNACASGWGCTKDTDCASKVCKAGVCAFPTCTDKVKNDGETDVDCGGKYCPACADGKGCGVKADCISGSCVAGKCTTPSCTDKVKNGSETDVDCGGGSCPGCDTGKACALCADCKGGFCDAAVSKCATAASCAAIKKGCASAPDGAYKLDPDGAGGTAPFMAQCEMTFLGGGWLAVYNMMKLPSNNSGAATMYKSITTRAAMTAPVSVASSSKAIHTTNLPLKSYTEVVYGWAASSTADVSRYGTYKKAGGLASECYLAKTCSNNATIATFSIMPQQITRALNTGNSPTYPHVGIGWTGQQILWGYDKNASTHGHWANWSSSKCCLTGNTADAAKAGWRYVIYIR